MKTRNKKYQKGFSLVELAVALIIISFIAGGVIGGASMIEAAKLRAVISEVEEIKEAIDLFRKKYHSLPGDMIDAEDYWGSGVNGVVNGNGDSNIETGNEDKQVWRHLYFAKLFSGNYTGSGSTSIGVNVPTSNISNAGYIINHQLDVYSQEGNFIFYGLIDAEKSVLTPSEAKNIDLKMDDGFADSGSVLGYDGSDVTSGSCTTSTTAPASYVLSNIGVVCRMYFILD